MSNPYRYAYERPEAQASTSFFMDNEQRLLGLAKFLAVVFMVLALST